MWRAAVIGLGNIGQGYDYDVPDASRVLTHATGFLYHPHFQLVAGVDPDPGARRRFEAKFQQPAYGSVAELYRHDSPEVVSIGVPTALHGAVLQEVMPHAPRAVLCEKPLAATVAEGRQMHDRALQAHCPLLVNYMRRFEPGVLALRQRIDAQEFGEIYKGTVWYSKGILNNGSHFLDLLRFLLGEVKAVALLGQGRRGLADPEPDVQITLGKAEVYFLAGREECFSIKEVELLGTKGAIKYSRGGEVIEVKRTGKNPLFPTQTILAEQGGLIATDLPRYQLHVLEALHQALAAGRPLNSDSATALQTLAVMDTIIKLVKEQGDA